MKRFKIYLIEPSVSCYKGFALVSAENAEKANQFISSFKESDKSNWLDSWGYSYVNESNIIEGIYSEEDGILKYGIYYYG